MRNATIVIVNLKGIAAETVKNIVLAGIGSLHLYDSENVTEEDLGASFLFREEDVGKKASPSFLYHPVRSPGLTYATLSKRVDAARPKIEALNPLVSVKTFSDPTLLSEVTLPQALQGVSLVCVTDSTRDELVRTTVWSQAVTRQLAFQVRLNAACRKASILFYAGGTYGLLGYIFVDLLSHQHLAPYVPFFSLQRIP